MRLLSIPTATLLVSSIAVVVLAGDGPATETTLADRVARLVEALDAPLRSERREAERRLLELGPEALPHLPPVDRVETASARETVRRLRRQLELTKAEHSLRASTVTFQGRATLGQVLAEITRQTGNPIDTSKVPADLLGKNIDADLEDVEFWRCLDDLADQHDLRYVPADNGRALGLEPVARRAKPARVVYSGAFRMDLGSLRRRSFFGSDQYDLVRATVEVRAEPRLRPLFAKYRGDAIRVVGKDDRTLPPLNPDAVNEPPVALGSIAPRWDVRVPSETAVPTADVSGTLALVVAAGSETIRFPSLDQATNVERRRGGVVVRTTRATFGDGRAEIDVSVTYDSGGPAFESHRTWFYDNGARLEGDADRRFAPVEPPQAGRASDGAVLLRYRFDKLPGEASDYRFVYVLPTLVVEKSLEFEWKDVPVEQPPRIGADE